MSDGAQQIAAERGRQIVTEGYTAEYDLTAGGAEPLMEAALCYAGHALALEMGADLTVDELPAVWPWKPEAFKPSTTKRDLVKAGALIAAAIDQIDLEQQAATTPDSRGFDFSSMRGVPADAPAAEEG